jgi:hypothetical protein
VNEQEQREAVRRAYGYRCAYCGVQEEEAGSELEIDHFQPRSVGGGDDLDNLVYCCPTCNRLKGDFWPMGDPSTTNRRLLHPKRDDLAAHLREEMDGRLTALTETGAFHIERLRLNRPPLVVLRRTRHEGARLRLDLVAARAEQVRLLERIASLERESEEVLTQLARLLGP